MLRVKTEVGKHGFDWCLLGIAGTPHAPRDVPANRATTVATNMLGENIVTATTGGGTNKQSDVRRRMGPTLHPREVHIHIHLAMANRERTRIFHDRDGSG